MPIPQFDLVHYSPNGGLEVAGPMPPGADAGEHPVVICYAIVQGDVIVSGQTSSSEGRWFDLPEDANAAKLTPDQPALCSGVAVCYRSQEEAPAFEVATWTQSMPVTEGVLPAATKR